MNYHDDILHTQHKNWLWKEMMFVYYLLFHITHAPVHTFPYLYKYSEPLCGLSGEPYLLGQAFVQPPALHLQ